MRLTFANLRDIRLIPKTEPIGLCIIKSSCRRIACTFLKSNEDLRDLSNVHLYYFNNYAFRLRATLYIVDSHAPGKVLIA
jgi:hypothetical protein